MVAVCEARRSGLTAGDQNIFGIQDLAIQALEAVAPAFLAYVLC